MVILSSLLSLIHNHLYRSGTSSIMMIKENIYTVFFGVAFRPFSPYFESFNERIDQMIDSGLTAYWTEQYLNPKGLRKSTEKIGPQILTLEDLGVGFQVCCAPLAFSFTAFVIELGYFWERAAGRILVEKFLPFKIVKILFNTK